LSTEESQAEIHDVVDTIRRELIEKEPEGSNIKLMADTKWKTAYTARIYSRSARRGYSRKGNSSSL
jgi:hypothetical protein